MNEIAITPALRGVEISRALPGAPRVVSMPSADAVIDPSVLKAINIDRPEEINVGMQAHYLTGANDALVVRPDPKTIRQQAQQMINVGMEVTAKLWKAQIGAILRAPIDDGSHLRMVPPDQLMAAFAAKSVDLGRERFVAAALYPGIAGALPEQSPELRELVANHTTLGGKNAAMRILAEIGIPVPFTVALERSSAVAALGKLKLPDNQRYLVKPDGGVGGFGMVGNDARGLSAADALATAAKFATAPDGPARFQIQQHVGVLTRGAVAVLDGRGGVSLASIHTMVEHDGFFSGVSWSRGDQEQLQRKVLPMFQRLAAYYQRFRIVGPVGFDIRDDGSNLTVIEVNPRLTGASVIGVILSKSASAVQRIDVDALVKIPERLFQNATRLHDVFADAIAEAEAAIGTVAGRPMILPQGLSPFDSSRIAFVNDRDQVLATALKRRLGLEGEGH